METNFSIRGILQSDLSSSTGTKDIAITSQRRLVPGSARDAGVGQIEAAGDEVVRVELENGFVLWTRVDDLIQERGRKASSRDGGVVWEIDTRPPLHGAQAGERGWLGLGIKVLEFFGLDLKGRAAGALGVKLEEKVLGGNTPGLYQCPLEDGFKLVAGSKKMAGGEQPLLVFIHGTGSSCEGSFGKLWDEGNTAGAAARRKLKEIYGDRVYAWEHRSLTVSPIQNALELARCIPANANVHLVSHSRGGMVGELLCLAQRDRSSDPLKPEFLQQLFAADRTLAEQIGLSPLDKAAAGERDETYAEDRDRLGELQQLLDKIKPKIQRFVRVACPARGTTLASGRLDRWLSVISYFTGNGLVGDGADFLLAVVKERTDPRTLPGLEAMIPGSALTRMLQHPALTTESDLTVIAGDIESSGVWSKIKLRVTDWFYGSDHDLVVNTGSMYGGIRRSANAARFRRDQGSKVNHFNYFTNAESIDWLVAGLTRADSSHGGFRPLVEAVQEEPRWRQAVRRSRAATEKRPLAVIVPGTMGSALQVRGKTVWLNYWALLWGGLKRLDMDETAVEPVELLDDVYGPLLEFLAHSHRVEIFPYDWRMSVQDAAGKLADQLESWLPRAERESQSVHLVAHSMGGLVVRAMIADQQRGAQLWQRVKALPNSRFMMLGTPNLGSYEAVRWLTGGNPTQAKLSLLDITQGTNDIIELVSGFPGLVELLPFDAGSPDFSRRELWQKLKDALHASWGVTEEDVLLQAMRTWALLKASAPEPAHMIYVAGCQDATVADYQLVDDSKRFKRGRKRLEYIGVREGDGTVTWQSGFLPGVPVWYVEDTAHDQLCAQQRALPGYLDLLLTGSTTRLAHTPPARSRAAAGESERFPMPALPPTDDIPDQSSVRSFGFGAGRPYQIPGEQPVLPVIKVRVRHADLAYARHPVLVGHYMGDTIVGSEAALDQRLDGALEQRMQLGIYPEQMRSHALFFNENPEGKPRGAVVVGLGQVGELTCGLLEGGVRSAMMDYALQVAQCSDERFGSAGSVRSAALSCLLVGSGPGGVRVRDSVEAILRAAVTANERLGEADLHSRVIIDEIEFLELYQDMALAAARALDSILVNGPLADRVTWPEKVIEPGQGHRRRVRFDEAPGWWHRLEIIEDKGRGGLRFIASTNRARAEITQSTGQLRLAESFIREASRSSRSSADVAKTLFEILLPNRLKQMAPEQRDLVLLVDDVSARYPWELLQDRWSQGEQPMAVAAGLVRQLKTPRFRAHPAHAVEANAFVVGNPDLGGWESFPDLPGARQEAQKVAELLTSGGYRVSDSIDEKAKDILEGLYSNGWRILHLAGHGEYRMKIEVDVEPEESDKGASTKTDRHIETRKEETRTEIFSGMVIGNKTFLTPGDVAQMRWVPELVFINCCHLGKTSPSRPGDYGQLAANLGMQFINMGVKAVVAAGWAVDDGAATAFAACFYRQLLEGESFGEAVRAARQDTLARYPDVNTWGAYQCYGDPGFKLHGNRVVDKPDQGRCYYAPVELVADLESLAEKIRVQVNSKGNEENTDSVARMRADIEQLLGGIPHGKQEQWAARADVAAAVGFAWGETGAWEEAVQWLDKALRAEEGDCPVRAVEQCANFRVRLSAQTWLKIRSEDASDSDFDLDADKLAIDRAALVEEIELAIRELDYICERGPTAERLSLLGSACKRLAWINEEDSLRLEALVNMADYFRRAFELDPKQNPYPFSNWALAEMLAERIFPEHRGKLHEVFEDECHRMAAVARERNIEKPDFWDGVGEADCKLLVMLVNSEAGQVAGNQAAVITELYRAAAQRGASPREYASVREHLDFVIQVANFEPGSDLGAGLGAIRAAL